MTWTTHTWNLNCCVGYPVINNWEMQGARGSLALESKMKELAQFLFFFFSFSPLSLSSPLSTDCWVPGPPARARGTLGLLSFAGSPLSILSLSSRPARVDSHPPSSSFWGGGDWGCSAPPPPSRMSPEPQAASQRWPEAGAPVHLQPAGGCRDSHSYLCWQANGFRRRRPRGHTLEPRPPAGAVTDLSKKADVGSRSLQAIKVFASVFIPTSLSCSAGFPLPPVRSEAGRRQPQPRSPFPDAPSSTRGSGALNPAATRPRLKKKKKPRPRRPRLPPSNGNPSPPRRARTSPCVPVVL